jgi:outer membrane lipoprotein SlyB
MKTIILTMASLVMAASLNAGSIDGNAVLGSMVGAGVGSAVGSSIGGKEGAIIGGGAGGALGAAVGSSKTSTPARTTNTAVQQREVYVDEHRYHDNGKHKGHDKHREGHGRDRD